MLLIMIMINYNQLFLKPAQVAMAHIKCQAEVLISKYANVTNIQECFA